MSSPRKKRIDDATERVAIKLTAVDLHQHRQAVQHEEASLNPVPRPVRK